MENKNQTNRTRVVKAVHGRTESQPDPGFEIGLSENLREIYGKKGLMEIYPRFSQGDGYFDSLMRRAIWRALARDFGHCVNVNSGVGFKHLETFEIGNRVFIGANTFIQGRYDGNCRIGDNVWIGPQSYFDARDLVIEEYVGWGPGAKVLGSEHTGIPADMHIIQTDLQIRAVKIEAGADIGVNAVILPGVTVGRGSQVGAGAIVTKDVPPFSVVAGIPAKVISWRQGGT